MYCVYTYMAYPVRRFARTFLFVSSLHNFVLPYHNTRQKEIHEQDSM